MTTYKQKAKQFVVNSARQSMYIMRDDLIIFNLNACFVKRNNFTRFETLLKECIEKGGKRVNLCNLASMCYKLEMDYTSKETLDFVQRLVDITKKLNLKIVQESIQQYGETDMKPFDILISFDRENNVVYVNTVLLNCLKVLGYVDSQIRDIVDFTPDFRVVIPEDLTDELPISNKKTQKAYVKIMELL